MIELISDKLIEWTKKKDILKILKSEGVTMDERTFRKMVEIHNQSYFEHKTDKYLAHSSRGYKLTSNKDEIIASAKDYRTRAFNQLVKASKTLKAMGENDNIRLEVKNGEFIVAQF
nr:MAG TPA: hypothetical protein [Caudoviricetes sp.]